MDEKLSYIPHNRQQATEPRGSLLFFVNILFVRLSFNSYVLLKYLWTKQTLTISKIRSRSCNPMINFEFSKSHGLMENH